MAKAVWAVLACSLAACTPLPEVTTPGDLSTCGAAGLTGLVGQPLAALPEAGGWGALRVVRPGMMVTMDYSAARLNVGLDSSDVILTLSCG
jgi:Peptidase inhibitor I78 family